MSAEESPAAVLAGQFASKDPAAGLEPVVALRRLLRELERLPVDNAHDQGWTWRAISTASWIGPPAGLVGPHGGHRAPGRRLQAGDGELGRVLDGEAVVDGGGLAGLQNQVPDQLAQVGLGGRARDGFAQPDRDIGVG
jgi:hypothetical protein